MEATCSSETPVDFQQTTRRYTPEDRTLHNHCSENLKSYKYGPSSEQSWPFEPLPASEGFRFFYSIGPPVFISLDFGTIFFYRARLSALRPTPNLEDQVSVFTMSPSDRVVQLYPQAPDSLFVHLLPIAELRWRYCNPLPREETPWLLVRTRTIPTERPPLVSEVSANFCG
jgi:hypothetical protein